MGDLTDVNSQGDLLGFYVDPNTGKSHPFIKSSNGKTVELDFPGLAAIVAQEAPPTRGGMFRIDGATMLYPQGMNDRGDFVGLVGVGYSDTLNPFPLDLDNPHMAWFFGNSRGFLAEARNRRSAAHEFDNELQQIPTVALRLLCGLPFWGRPIYFTPGRARRSACDG